MDELNSDTSAYAKHIGVELPKNLARDICFGLLIGDGYLDFRDAGGIVGRAKQVPVDSTFVDLTATMRKSIDHFYVLRSYVAHRSQRDYRRYRDMLETEFGYQRVVRHGVFLRTEGSSLGKPRLEFFLHRFREASETIRKNAAF